jgi:hypothetical protein
MPSLRHNICGYGFTALEWILSTYTKYGTDGKYVLKGFQQLCDQLIILERAREREPQPMSHFLTFAVVDVLQNCGSSSNFCRGMEVLYIWRCWPTYHRICPCLELGRMACILLAIFQTADSFILTLAPDPTVYTAAQNFQNCTVPNAFLKVNNSKLNL